MYSEDEMEWNSKKSEERAKMHAKRQKPKAKKKKCIALQQSSNYKTIKQRGKKDNPDQSEQGFCFVRLGIF